MSGRRGSWLAARREIRERLRSRAFRISTLIQVLAVVVVAVIVSVTGGGETTMVKVGAIGETGEGIVRMAERAAPSIDLEVDSERYANEAEARDAIARGDLDAASGAGPLLVSDGISEEAMVLLSEAASAGALKSALTAEGIPPRRSAELLAESRVVTETVSTGDDNGGGIAFIATLLLYLALVFCGYAVSSGVVEEKATRVVELVINAIRPRELLAGKVLGIGAMGLAQLLLIVGAGLGTALALGEIELPAATLDAALLALLYFVLGFALYGCAFAVAGSLVSRQEDSSTTTAPVMILLVAAYIVSISAAGDPGSRIAVVSTLLPPVAPLTVPARAAAGDLPPEQLIISVLLMLASCALLIWLAGRVYERTVLRLGAPLHFTEVLRAMRK